MKRHYLQVCSLALLIAAFGLSASAQSVITIKLGTFNPQDAKAGFIGSLVYGRQVDERVDFGLGADLFIRKFKQEATVDTGITPGGTTVSDVQTMIEYSMYGLPIMAHLSVRILPNAIVKPYAELAAGYEIVFSREANYQVNVKDNRLYGGFGWQLMLGGEYGLGSSSGVLAEILYNGCTVKRGTGTNTAGFPTHEELNFSGFGFRVGFRLAGM